MKFLPLIWAGLWRKPLRTTFSFLSVLVAFLLYGMLGSVNGGFQHIQNVAKGDRLLVDPSLSFNGAALPRTYADQIEKIPGVEFAAPHIHFMGNYRTPRDPVFINGADTRYFNARPEILATPEQQKLLADTPNGVLLTNMIAEKYGWKVGDSFPLQSPTVRMDGQQFWEFQIIGLIDDANFPGQAYWALTNDNYIDDTRKENKGTADRILVRIADANDAARIGNEIDEMFANSAAPTRTVSEKSSGQAGVDILGDINFLVDAIVVAVMFMLVFMTSSTTMQSVNERVPEFAVMKTLGFSTTTVMAVLAVEIALGIFIGAVLGIAASAVLMPQLTGLNLPYTPGFPWGVLAFGMGTSVIVALLTCFGPAMRLRRLSIVDALAGR